MTTGRNRALIIIPARMDSKRFPGKPLVEIDGVPLVRRTYERAKQCASARCVLVATPNPVIAAYCDDHKVLWRPTLEDHPSGTHRCAEVLAHINLDPKPDVVVNWQCDELNVDPVDVERLVDSARTRPEFVWTAVKHDPDDKLLADPNVVKAIVAGFTAYWFSRAPMTGASAHVGVYAYSAEMLRRLGEQRPTRFARLERLEQLTWIENGVPIKAIGVKDFPRAVNVPGDVENIVQDRGLR